MAIDDNDVDMDEEEVSVDHQSSNVFSPELLRMYYERLFPYDLFEQWLSYGKGEELIARREFSFTLKNDQYIRYKSFRNAEEMKLSTEKMQPHKIDIGAVFTISPGDKGTVPDSEFKPTERELVFDVDLTDYDDIRTCCSGASTCRKCWIFMVAAVKVLDASLREDFGFKHLIWVYSGRRGIHCWVADTVARTLTNEARGAVVQYLSLVESSANTKRKIVLKEPIHPFLQRSLQILEAIFEEHLVSEGGQNILSQEHWKKLLAMIPDDEIQQKLDEEWRSPRCSATGKEKWEDVKQAVNNAVTSLKRKHTKADDKRRSMLRKCTAEIVFAYIYPRLDANVSRQRNHLLKSPFSIHPKTGRVCVPIDPTQIDKFDPFGVPTLGSLEKELNEERPHDIANGAPTYERTSLAKSIGIFRNFLKPMEMCRLASQRERAERGAALTGDW